MKKLFLVAVLLAVWALGAFAQYPQVTVRQLQEVSRDSLLLADKNTAALSANANSPLWTLQTSRYLADTVVVTGVVSVPAMVITYTATGWTLVLSDTSQGAQT
ncbi:MAG TPA: hypothetical protein VF889_02710, partial [Bacteroidota bacterium]